MRIRLISKEHLICHELAKPNLIKPLLKVTLQPTETNMTVMMTAMTMGLAGSALITIRARAHCQQESVKSLI